MKLSLWHWISAAWFLCAMHAFGGNFEQGPYDVSIKAMTKGENGIPKRSLLFLPQNISNKVPVIYFNHGFLLANSYYEDLLAHISSYGYIIVAPQHYAPGGLPIGKPNKEEEFEVAIDILDWIEINLENVSSLPIAKGNIGLLGHSRGGAITYMLGEKTYYARALATIDPVDGDRDGTPRVIDGPLSFKLPSFNIGTGLGGISKGLGGACAPRADNHNKFFVNSPSPALHLVVEDYGHMDMLDPDTSCGFICNSCVSASSKFSREDLRKQIAGSLVSFFHATLKNENSGEFDGVLNSFSDVKVKTQIK